MIKRLLFLGFASSLCCATAQAQVTPAALTTSPYRQNFDVLATTGTTNAKTTLPAGWDFVETGTSALADNLYAADNGAANGGNTYSYGATNDTDRALGTLLSGSLTATIGAAFTNSTGAALPNPRIAYTGETWRIGGTTRADKLSFQYSLDATSLSTGTWVDATALDYSNTPVTTAVTGGVSTPIQTATITGTLTGVTIPVGATVWIRWNDFNAAGSDDGMAVDDFSLSWGAVAPTTSLALSTSALVFGGQNISTTSAAQTYSLTGTQLTGDVTVTATGPFTVSKDNTAFSTTLTLTTAELSAAKTLYVKFSPTASGTATGSITHTSAGAASAVLALTGTGVDPTQTTFNFNTCTNGLSDGWLQYSVTGPQTWGCTTFGRDPAAPTGTAAAPNGVQINGYSGGNIENEDWFISPGFNLSTYTYPLFSFWSRTAFSGPGLKLRVSTNYSGSGAPSAATWTDLNVRFPENGSDIWTESPNFNLAAYKGTKVYLAFVYTSSTSEAARWTLDDISLTNSATPPAPTLFANVKQVAFGYQAINTNGDRTLSVSANDLTGDITLTSSNAAFTLSKDGTTFASTLTLTRAEANGTAKTVTVRFRPTQASTSITGTITATTPGAAASTTVAVAGDTYDPAKTLEVVNWNMEWFGSPDPTLGPTNKDLQKTNATTVLTFLKADVYALEEVVDTVRLKAVVAQLSTNLGVPYAYKISQYGSYADNPQDVADYVSAQKLTFIYRTDMVKNPAFLGLLRCSEADNCPAFRPWASGRFPYLMSADVTLDGVTKRVNFIVIHAKANSTATSADDYARRATGATLLKNLLDTSYANGNTLIVGDYNDVLNGTIATGVTPAVSSYSVFLNDANYVPISLPLAQAGLRSTASYPTVIDNVIANKNMAQYYINGTASVRTDAAALIANYASTTSDHYPIFTRYSFANVLATKTARTASLGLYPNPVTNAVRFEVPETGANLTLDVHTVDGRLVLRGTGSVEQLNQQLNQRVAGLSSGLYLIRVVGTQQTYTDRFEKQ
ncbi:T9SS-dependent choice-of-anchor J family protein [Hymenobacter ginkgonis]|nr:choice-of-anchor J domain-containing protein [Hymenobacter ginkgonis]